jgi:beta-N-acetylhexosaminidase
MNIGFDGIEMSPRLASLLTKIQPGGVILFARNIAGAEQTHTLLRECQKCVATPLFTCVDLEGGTVDRFRNVIGSTPSPAEVFATSSRALFRKHGRVIGENCRALGFNVDFAPVLDLAYEASRPVMSSRAVSDDPKRVIAYAREFLRGLGDAGIVGCGKHFPGLGEATLDTHHELPSVHKSLRKLWEQDLVPYRVLRRELPMVMVSHAAFPEVTGAKEKDKEKRTGTPASLSKKWISDVLRKKIGYRGLICSDDLQMGGVLAAAPIRRTSFCARMRHYSAKPNATPKWLAACRNRRSVYWRSRRNGLIGRRRQVAALRLQLRREWRNLHDSSGSLAKKYGWRPSLARTALPGNAYDRCQDDRCQDDRCRRDERHLG